MPAKHLMPGKDAVLAAANAGMQAHPAEAHAVRAADATSAVNAENSPK